MSRATVRAALTTFLTDVTKDGANSIPGLAKMHRAVPYWLDGGEWDLPANLIPGAAASAVAALHFKEDGEHRIDLPAPNIAFPGQATGQKMVVHHIGLIVFYQWLVQSSSLASTDPEAWVDPLDDILDGLKAKLRTDPTAGTADPETGLGTVIWQCAQDPDDLRIQSDLPRTLAGKVLAWNVIEFKAYEVAFNA